MLFILLMPITFAPPAVHYTLMCSFSLTRITSQSLLVDPEPAEKIISLLLSEGISRVKRASFHVSGVGLRSLMPDGHQLNECYLQLADLLC